jgi:death-on-curing protein
MISVEWIELNAVLAMHSRQIAEHGGSDGVRDLGLLSSALARPLNLLAYVEDSDIAALAAAYAFGIAKNHPFVDGNKRTALVVMRTFLLINGYGFTASAEDKYTTFIALADGSLDEDELAEWIRKGLA